MYAGLYHDTAQRRVIALCRTYGDWGPVIAYLISYGQRDDRVFFSYWKDNGVMLSGEQKARLSEALSIWTKLYTLEFYGKELNYKGLLGTLENDVAELSAQIKRLKAQDEKGLKVD
jgi:hypothetical protein